MDSLSLRADLTDIVSYLDTKARFRGDEAEKRESEWDQLLRLRKRKGGRKWKEDNQRDRAIEDKASPLTWSHPGQRSGGHAS